MGGGAKSYDREKACSLINPSMLSADDYQIKIYKKISPWAKEKPI
jgi:hypothetical protein